MKNVQCAAGPRAPARPDSSCVCVLFSLIFVCQTSEPSHAFLATAQTTILHTQYNIIYKNNIPYTANHVQYSSTSVVNSLISSYYCNIALFYCTAHVRLTYTTPRVSGQTGPAEHFGWQCTMGNSSSSHGKLHKLHYNGAASSRDHLSSSSSSERFTSGILFTYVYNLSYAYN